MLLRSRRSLASSIARDAARRAARPRGPLSLSSCDREGPGVDVQVVPDLKVGCVMGIGDQVPIGLQQLGARVTLLTEHDLATGICRATTPS